MRFRLAIVFSLICGPVAADDSVSITSPTVNTTQVMPISIGRPHVCMNNYPAAAILAHAEGTTQLSFTITTEGTVKDIKLATSSGNTDLDEAAVKCAADWQYRPGLKDGKPVEKPWKVNIAWKIPDTLTVGNAADCLKYRIVPLPIQPNVGITTVKFRVMPDGTIKQAVISRSSGDLFLDFAAARCILDVHFDTSSITVPPDGMPGQTDMDWPHELGLPPVTQAK
jgi:TonB family protein